MKSIAKRVSAVALLALVGLFCFAGPSVAQKLFLPPDLQGHVDMVAVVEDAANAVDLVSILIADNPEYATEIAAAAAKLRPDLADEFMALLTAPSPTPTPTNVELPQCPPGQSGGAFLDCLPKQSRPTEAIALSDTLLETLENPNVVSPSQ